MRAMPIMAPSPLIAKLDAQSSADYAGDNNAINLLHIHHWKDSDFMKLADLKAREGELIGISDWFIIDQSRIDKFASVTEDEQFIHTNPEKAAKTLFGGTIAHGFLSLSLLPAMGASVIPKLDGHKMSVNYGFEKIRFIAPVRSGVRVRGHFHLTRLEERKPGEITMLWEVEVEIEEQEKPALYAQWLNRRYLAVD
jgi:acyl dehydratase